MRWLLFLPLEALVLTRNRNLTHKAQSPFPFKTRLMDVREGAYGAYAYVPGVGLSMASDYYCYGKKENVSYALGGKERFSL